MPPRAKSNSKDAEARIAYLPPWAVYVPTVVSFAMLNYLACCTTVNETGDGLVLPSYVQAAADRRASLLQNNQPPPFNLLLFFEEEVMGFLFGLGCRLFGGMDGIQLVLVAAWIIHFFELGMCVRICWACRATPLTFATYCFCTVTSGFAQLVPLMNARRMYLDKVGKTPKGKKD